MESAVIATHARRMGRDKTITDPQHYLQVLERKPGALRNGLPFQKLPRAITLVQEHLQAKAGGDKAFVEVLLAARDHGMDILETACAMALEQKTVTVTVILNLVHRLAHPFRRSLSSPFAHFGIGVPPLGRAPSYACRVLWW
ncbi:IS21 family transposase, partial [Acidithiobacillus sp. RW2]|nr:IS21 family transposase [Acidithiobacillus sulfurivorans]